MLTWHMYFRSVKKRLHCISKSDETETLVQSYMKMSGWISAVS